MTHSCKNSAVLIKSNRVKNDKNSIDFLYLSTCPLVYC